MTLAAEDYLELEGFAEPNLTPVRDSPPDEWVIPEGIDPLEWLLLDFEAFCYVCLKVQDKQTLRPVPLLLKPVQRKLAAYCIRCLIDGVPIRVIILKARREGMSTVIQAFMYWRCSQRPDSHSLTIAHDVETSKYLHGMAERYYRFHPGTLRPSKETGQRGLLMQFGNPSKRESDREADPGLQSSMRTASLENAGAGTGVLWLHLSEFARWEGEKGEDASTTALQTVPDAPGTAIFIESTAQGASGEFYDMWLEAESPTPGQEGRGYTPFFFAWWEEPTYVARVPHGFVRTPDEEALVELAASRGHHLTDEQLQWRRQTIRLKCKGRLKTFQQEYPSIPEEAFLTSGRPFFDAEAIAAYREAVRRTPPARRGMLHAREKPSPMVEFRDHADGYLSIWEAPRPDEDYIIFADCAAGTGDEGDYQCAYVMPRSRMEIVACWYGKIDRGVFADQLRYLGKLYAGRSAEGSRVGAQIAVEVTGGWGETVVSILKREQYPNLYRRNRNETGKRRRRSESYGWETTVRTRALALDTLAEAILSHELDMNDKRLAEECRTFIYGNDGKPQAQAGRHDDCVITAAGLCYLWATEPRPRHGSEKLDRRENTRSRKPLSSVTGY